MTTDPLDELREDIANVMGSSGRSWARASRCAFTLERVLALLDEWDRDFPDGHFDIDCAWHIRSALTGEPPHA